MHIHKKEIFTKGQRTFIDAVTLEGKEIIAMGKFLKIAKVDEELYNDIEDPSSIINGIKTSGLKVDIFTFWQRLPYTEPKYDYYMEWDNFAAVPISTYDNWFKNQINRNARRAIKNSIKSGVDVRIVDLDEGFIRGIVSIFNESKIRQGKEFWHYGKGFSEVKEEIILRDAADSVFAGAYYGDELIGFIKLILTKEFANFAQILGKMGHRDKSPTNALVAKAVEICAERSIPYLVYERFVYGRKGADSLTEFKRRNGFEKIDVPRYYVPLNLWGSIVVKAKLHHGPRRLVPEKMERVLRDLRRRLYTRKVGKEIPAE